MASDRITMILAQASGTASGPGGMIQTITMMGGMMLLLWLLMIRPQQKKQKEQAEMLKVLKPNDRVVTSSGIVGAVVTVKEKEITLRTGDAKIEVTKASITEVIERAS